MQAMPVAQTRIPSISSSLDAQSPGLKRGRRPGNACAYCHGRKIRCDAGERDQACSNCLEQARPCVKRRRKNARISPAVDDQQTPPDRVVNQDSLTLSPSVGGLGSTPATEAVGQDNAWIQESDALQWNPQNFVYHNDIGGAAPPMSADFDLSNLVDIESLFTFTGDGMLPPAERLQWGMGPGELQPLQQPSASSASLPASSDAGQFLDNWTSITLPGLSPTDQRYLQGEGCFVLPPPAPFRQIIATFFRFVHTTIPIINEAGFWELWKEENFNLEDFSLLVVQAMMFAACSFVSSDLLSSLGYPNRREAKLAYYKRAKLLFDFAVEQDAVANSQACLLLTYRAPNYNRARVNTYWLTNAIRFARIAGADAFHTMQDRPSTTTLKRLWWGILFRDRILSLGLRRSLQLELLDPALEREANILQLADFQCEIGRSLIHDSATQTRIVQVITCMCRLVQCLTPALRIYNHERLPDRLQSVSNSLPTAVTDTTSALEGLRQWYEQTTQVFPFPVSLDDTDETICVLVNMLFFYHGAAVFALNVHRHLIDELLPESKPPLHFDKSREAMVAAMEDTTKRTIELVQGRLVGYLPVSAVPLLCLPLVLQAVNATAARGSAMERVEMRKLEVFTKALKRMQVNYDGADFFSDVVSNIVTYAEADPKFLASMTAWRGGQEASSSSTLELRSGNEVIKLGWENLMQRRRKLFLRLLFHLDCAICTGGCPKDVDFPKGLCS